MLELKSTRKEFVVETESGRSFTVSAEYDSEFNTWSAAVAIGSDCEATDIAAIKALRPGLQQLLKVITELED